MKIALVTGATSGIGYEISKRLLKMNYAVYGIGRNFIKNDENIFKEYENFIPVTCDLSKLDDLEKTLHSLKKMRNQNQNSEILYYPFEYIDGGYTYSDKTKSYMINFIKEQFLKYIKINKIYI